MKKYFSPRANFNAWLATVALANDTAPDLGEVLALENELALDNDGWALLAPFGEHRKTRTVQRDGKIIQETFVQVFDEAAVDAVLANENGGIFTRLKRAFIKRPIYNGHPDVRLYAPETVTLGNEKLIPLGLNQECRKTARGLEFRPLLVPDGKKAVEEDGCKFPSGLFLLTKTGRVREDGAIEVRPFKLASIGLTAHPNISGVDSLANAKPADQQQQTQTKEPTMKLIAGWLIAQNVALANCETPTETEVLTAIKKVYEARATEVVTLGNDKVNLTTTVNSLTTDRDAQKKRADEAETALANEQNALKAERKARLEATVDLVITQGRLALADREAKVSELCALANDKIDAALKALKEAPVKFAVGQSAISGERKETANNSSQEAQSKILALANTDEKYKSLSMADAMVAIKRDHPSLFEQLNNKA
jgi:hypothetical protein